MSSRYKRIFLSACVLGFWTTGLAFPSAWAGVDEDMSRAETLYDEHSLVDAIKIFRELAGQNYIPAQIRLGEILDYTEEDEEAVGWYITAAAQGDSAGASYLGGMYLAGEGIVKDEAQAFYWVKYAAEKGDMNAITTLASAYRKGSISGLPVQIDLVQAQFWEDKLPALRASHDNTWKERIDAHKKKFEKEKEARDKAKKNFAGEEAGQGQAK